MKIFTGIAALQECLNEARKVGKKIGFVPTMGALHQGHISLVKIAKELCDVCIVSIFVNPTQFNDPKDLATYPRTPEADTKLLELYGTDIVFAPSVDEIYPAEDTREFSVGRVTEVMEGVHRPGHFRGVMQVVSRLFDIVIPDKAFFGEKDFQQIAVIRAMTHLLGYKTEIISCPIVREEDGLALSSRNVRLAQEGRQQAPHIYRILSESKLLVSSYTPQGIEQWVTTQINAIPTLRVEYFEIVDSQTLEHINHWSDSSTPHGCIAVYCGDVRLIDNISYY